MTDAKSYNSINTKHKAHTIRENEIQLLYIYQSNTFLLLACSRGFDAGCYYFVCLKWQWIDHDYKIKQLHCSLLIANNICNFNHKPHHIKGYYSKQNIAATAIFVTAVNGQLSCTFISHKPNVLCDIYSNNY